MKDAQAEIEGLFNDLIGQKNLSLPQLMAAGRLRELALRAQPSEGADMALAPTREALREIIAAIHPVRDANPLGLQLPPSILDALTDALLPYCAARSATWKKEPRQYGGIE